MPLLIVAIVVFIVWLVSKGSASGAGQAPGTADYSGTDWSPSDVLDSGGGPYAEYQQADGSTVAAYGELGLQALNDYMNYSRYGIEVPVKSPREYDYQGS